ncbi:angiopoietin-related protein 3-like isoform 2-T2 [Clarias gariepinus]|uniref:angiopoietin-related protein 3-like isoform X2 n=1 Tax=Clarias gariepinus TaxID=13013 RepID=UPI00234D14DE|nr:angiopoietin-related protein 3-like isoform X2 [Clarias gariepinus]
MKLAHLSLAKHVTMKLALLLLLMLSTSAFPTAEDTEEPNLTPSESRSAFAGPDEVQLIANGLLQLGKNLRDFVQKTKGQISNILQKLNIFDKSFNQLSLLASEIKEEEEELKKTTVVLKANNEEIKSLSLEINSKVEDIMKERMQLWNQVGGLEEKLGGLSQGLLSADQIAEISALKEVIQTQERSISDLLKVVKEQSEHLNNQKNKIKSLENKLSSAGVQETLSKFSWDAEAYSVSEYLSNFSIDGSFSNFPRDCGEVFNGGEKTSGLYPIKPNGSQPFLALCEFTEEGVFTIIQRRQDGLVDFNQSWQSYENGFGDFRSEFWLGLRKIFSITQQGSALLRVQTEGWKQEIHMTEFQYVLEGPDSNYTIHLRTGDLPSDTDVPTGLRFSTGDHNDGNILKDPKCAHDYTGGWWFSACGDVNLNGKCIESQPRRKAIQGKPDKGHFKSTRISIRHHREA